MSNFLAEMMGWRNVAVTLLLILVYLREGVALDCQITPDISKALKVWPVNNTEVLQPSSADIEIRVKKVKLFEQNGRACKERLSVLNFTIDIEDLYEQDLLKNKSVRLNVSLCVNYTIGLTYALNDGEENIINFSYGPILDELKESVLANFKIAPKKTDDITFDFNEKTVEVRWKNLCGRSMIIRIGNESIKQLDSINPKYGLEIIELKPCEVVPVQQMYVKTFRTPQYNYPNYYYEEAYNTEAYVVSLENSDFDGYAQFDGKEVKLQNTPNFGDCVQNMRTVFSMMKDGKSVHEAELKEPIKIESELKDMEACEVYAIFVNVSITYQNQEEKTFTILKESVTPNRDANLDLPVVSVEEGEIKIKNSPCDYDFKIKFNRTDGKKSFIVNPKSYMNKPINITHEKEIEACTEYKISLLLEDNTETEAILWNSLGNLVAPRLNFNDSTDANKTEVDLDGYSNCDVADFLVECRRVDTKHSDTPSPCKKKCIINFKDELSHKYECRTMVVLKDKSESPWGDWHYVKKMKNTRVPWKPTKPIIVDSVSESSAGVPVVIALLLLLLLAAGIAHFVYKRRQTRKKRVQTFLELQRRNRRTQESQHSVIVQEEKSEPQEDIEIETDKEEEEKSDIPRLTVTSVSGTVTPVKAWSLSSVEEVDENVTSFYTT